MDSKITVASLFAGVGGICQGFNNAGAQVVWSNDNDKNACITYRENFSGDLVEKGIEDVKKEEVPNVDIITFGFPCTSFSIAGYRKGFEDENTGHLFFEALRIIKHIKPKAILLENVKNLVGHDKGKTFEIIKDALEDTGYHLKHKVLNTAEYANIPQNRERIFVVGFLDKESSTNFEFPEPIKLTAKIQEITKPHEKKDEKYYYRSNSRYYEMLSKEIKNKDTLYQLRRVYVRENKSNMSPTLTANMGTGGHNVPLLLDDFGIRKLTPRETFSLQGFPSDFKFPEGMANGHLYKQAGNAVTVAVSEKIAEQILKVI